MKAAIVPFASLLGAAIFAAPSYAQTSDFAEATTEAPTAPPSPVATMPALPPNVPAFFPPVYRKALKAPLPSLIYELGGVPTVVEQTETDKNSSGYLGSYQTGGATTTAGHAFFEPLGTNGRACITCHQPPSGMSINLDNIQKRFNVTAGMDPLFAPVDGATCPKNVPTSLTAPAVVGGKQGSSKSTADSLLTNTKSVKHPYYTLLNKGLIRIFLPVPQSAEYTVAVLSDPFGCNTDSEFNQDKDPATGVTSQIVSVYRRPVISSNLPFKTTTAANTGGFPPVDPLTFTPLPIDPFTNLPISGNIMWDGREPTLQQQAIDATLGHAQALNPPTQAQVQQMVAFETGFFSAQASDSKAGSLTEAGAKGGPLILSDQDAGLIAIPTAFTLYDAWAAYPGNSSAATTRAAIARGQAIFNNRTFTINNVAGFNDVSFVGNPVPAGTCSTCHNQANSGSDGLPVAQRDIGIGGSQSNIGGPVAASDLPVFEVTCKPGFTTPFNGTKVVTNDPGKALITGKCADIGRRTIPSMRALSAHAPYFSDGSAATLLDVVNVYNLRFKIGLTQQEKDDLVKFMNSL